MRSREENVAKIFRDYDIMRAKAEQKKNDYVRKVYDSFPRLEEISKERDRLGFQNIRNIMQNPDKAAELKEKFMSDLKKLGDEEEEIIRKNGIRPDFKEPMYECRICGDTGFVGNEKCECFKRKLIDMEYKNSNLSILVRENTFDKFNLDYYNDKIIPELGMSCRENMKTIYDSAVDFCNNFEDKTKNIIMIGSTGLGKTFMSNCIANEILKKGYSVSYVRSTSMFFAYEDYKFKREENNVKIDIDELYQCDLLIIDDFGTEYLTKVGVSFFFDLLNERLDRGKKIIINSNMGFNDITKFYSMRVTSRFYEHFKILHFYGEDIRIQKLKE